HHIRTTKPNMPVMLMTGFADMIELKEAYDIGASGFLAKPFNIRDLENSISEVLHIDHPLTPDYAKRQQLEIKRKRNVNDFRKVAIEEFSKGSGFNFPVYLKLSDEKIIKVANRGEDLSAEMIQRFRIKGISYLYFSKKDCQESLRLMTLKTFERAQAPEV